MNILTTPLPFDFLSMFFFIYHCMFISPEYLEYTGLYVCWEIFFFFFFLGTGVYQSFYTLACPILFFRYGLCLPMLLSLLICCHIYPLLLAVLSIIGDIFFTVAIKLRSSVLLTTRKRGSEKKPKVGFVGNKVRVSSRQPYSIH